MDVVEVGPPLTLTDVVAVAEGGARVQLAAGARWKVQAARALVDRLLARRQPVYGVTTGFGKFSDVPISPDEVARLQHNLLVSHAAGVGEPLDDAAVRAAMLLRAQALAQGHSGVRPEVIDLLLEFLNREVHPIIPQQGSLGASGDLAPLAHMALVLVGEGEARVAGRRLPGALALAQAGLEPIRLEAKEGLALINGTQIMTGIGALAVARARELLKVADIAAALTAEALAAIPDAWDPRIQAVRGHTGQAEAAGNLRLLTRGSGLLTAAGEVRVQDAYALRCIPQVHGAARLAVRHVADVLEAELNAVTDNPLLFPADGAVLSGGNFHGQPVAVALDYLGIGVAPLAGMSERRTERLLNPALSGLPAFLTRGGGLNSGLMILQYTAAALVSENKVLAHPASVDSIPSSANQEDHVSMGTIAARKARQIVAHTLQVLAIELIAAAQAVEFTDPRLLGAGTAAAYRRIRESIPPLEDDRFQHADILRAAELIESGELLRAVEQTAGPLA